MKKPEKSVKKRKASLKRNAKRGERAKRTLKEKAVRIAKKKEVVALEKRKFEEHMNRLLGKEAAN